MIALSLAFAAHAADEMIADALTTELKRNVAELSLPGAPPIYHLRYEAVVLDQTDVRASFG